MSQVLRQRAEKVARRIVQGLEPFCDRIEIAGSIRRGRPFVGDIDIVVLPKPEGRDALLKRVGTSTTFIKGGDQYAVFELANGMQLDLWIAHHALPETRDIFDVVETPGKPTNFGMLLLSRTGSFQHNIYLCSQAKSLGLHLNPHAGITQAGRVIASATEHDIFAALQMDFIAPERRER